MRNHMESKTFDLLSDQEDAMDVLAAHYRALQREQKMSSISARFVAQIRRNLELWRTHEIDYVTFTDWQRQTWAAITAAGRTVEAEVLRALWGAPGVWDRMLADDQRGTVQLRTLGQAPTSLAGRYCGELTRTATGSPVLTVSPEGFGMGHTEHRQVAALIYEIAAEMERHSHALEAHWTIAADPENSQIVIELSGDEESALAEELIVNVMTQRQLI